MGKRVMILKSGGGLSAEKAKEILRDGTAQGHKLTAKQKRYFGFIAGGGHPKANNGLEVEGNQYTPISNDTVVLGGKSHSKGGTDISWMGKGVEAEAGETVTLGNNGTATVMGNMISPLSGRKFKEDSKRIAEKERKAKLLTEEGTDLLSKNSPYDKWGSLAFNAGMIMSKGGAMKQQELKQSKDHLITLQQAMLDRSDELGVDPQEFSKGKLTAKNGLTMGSETAQAGKKIYLENLENYDSNWQQKMDSLNRVKMYRNLENSIMSKYLRKENYQTPINVQPLKQNIQTHTNSSIVSPNIINEKIVKNQTSVNQSVTPFTLPSDHPLNDPNISADFRNAYIKMMSEAPDFVRNNVDIKGGFAGYRTKEMQETLYNQGLQKYGKDKISGRVAVPGYSSHEFGLAGDFSFSDPNAEKWVRENSKKYGIVFRLPNDRNHGEYTPNGVWNKSMANSLRKNPIVSPEQIDENVKITPMDLTQYKLPENWEQTVSPQRVQGDNIPLPSLTPLSEINAPTNAKGLDFKQILPELYTAATNKQEPVWMQKYAPQLFQPFQMSFQDRLNENQATFNSLKKAAAYNPAALSTLAGQKYSSDSSVLADEFRTNQQISNEVTNKNIALLNDAQNENLKLADTQYVRQAQAKSNTKATNRAVLSSIADKLHLNEFEQQTQKVYENLYPYYRFDPKTGKAKYYGPSAGEAVTDIDESGNPVADDRYSSTNTTISSKGNKTIRINTPSQYQINKDIYEESTRIPAAMKKRNTLSTQLFRQIYGNK